MRKLVPPYPSSDLLRRERMEVETGVVDLSDDSKLTRPEAQRYWYGASISEFLRASSDVVLGQLTTNCTFALLPTQRDAWLAQIELLGAQIAGLTGSIFFEFNIPRMGRRIDVILVIGPVAFALEFKIGEKSFDRSSIEQVWDYALDLKNFHEASHDGVYRPASTNAAGLRGVIDLALHFPSGERLRIRQDAARLREGTGPTSVRTISRALSNRDHARPECG
jgi:hypothetical protein